MIPTYRKHSSGQARVVINGRCFYLVKYGSKASKRRYDALVAEWLASSRSSSFGLQRDTLTLSHLMLDYLRHCKRHYVNGPNSEHAPTKQVLRKVRQLYADLPAPEFGPAQFKAVRQLLIDSECGQKKRADDSGPRKKLSRSYINAQMKRVARMFRWAAAEGLVSPDVYNALRLIPSLQRGRTTARETERVKPVDEALVTATLPYCSPVVADMIRVQLLTGCRPSEVCMLTPRTTGSLYWRLRCPRCNKENTYLYLVGRDVLCQVCGKLKSRAPKAKRAKASKRSPQAKMKELMELVAKRKAEENRLIEELGAEKNSPIADGG